MDLGAEGEELVVVDSEALVVTEKGLALAGEEEVFSQEENLGLGEDMGLAYLVAEGDYSEEGVFSVGGRRNRV